MKPYDPSPEITLAVRTGFLSKAIWLEYYAPKNERWKNELWKILAARGYFYRHYSKRAQDVFVPNSKHPLVLKIAGDSITMAPPVGVIDHDETVVKSFLNLKKQDILGSAYFEGELKRQDLRSRRHYDPTDRTKYPDLLINLKGPNSNKKIALEVELSRKEPKRYRQMMNSFMAAKDISTIVFITNLETVKNGIKTAIRETYFPEWEKPIGFVSLDDWRSDPANANISFSETKQTLRQMSQTLIKI
ncbi:MAG: hypothetical protein SGJ18_06525 [Pseudomonadota bacterium]|nr:hypothetical protein [Pseudomonadota bacterium]